MLGPHPLRPGGWTSDAIYTPVRAPRTAEQFFPVFASAIAAAPAQVPNIEGVVVCAEFEQAVRTAYEEEQR